MTVAADAW